MQVDIFLFWCFSNWLGIHPGPWEKICSSFDDALFDLLHVFNCG